MPRSIDQIVEAYNSILYPVYQSALPRESRKDPHFLADVLDQFKDVLRGAHLARLAIAEAEGKTAGFLRDTFAQFLKGNNELSFREGERRRTNLFFAAAGARERLNLRRTVYDQYMDWAGELAHELRFSDLNDNTVRYKIQLLARRLEVFIKETGIIGRFIQEQQFPVSNEDMEYYVVLLAQHETISSLETPVAGLRRFYAAGSGSIYGEKETGEVKSWFNEVYLRSVNPFAFAVTLGRFFEFYPPAQKTPGLPGDECAGSSASARCRSWRDAQDGPRRSPKGEGGFQGTAGLPAGLHNNQVRINGPAEIPGVVPENPNFVRVVMEEVVLAAAKLKNPSVSIDFAWDGENKDLLMDIRGVTLKDFVDVIKTSSSIAKSLGISGQLPAEILSATYFRLLLHVPVADGAKSAEGGSGPSGTAPNDPMPPASPISGGGAGNFASATQNVWVPFNAGAAIISSAMIAFPVMAQTAPSLLA